MAKQPIKFEMTPSKEWDCLLANGDEVTGVEEVRFSMEAKGGPFAIVKFKIDSGTMQTSDT